jgi:hypothetical protein
VAAAVEAAPRLQVISLLKNTRAAWRLKYLTTVPSAAVFGGLVAEFVSLVRDEYRRTLGESSSDWKLIQDGWYYEPSVAERVFDRLLEKEAERLQFWRKHHLALATVRGDRVADVELDTPTGGRMG